MYYYDTVGPGYSRRGRGGEVKTPLDIYLQRHSPLSPDLWLHYSRLSARYTGRHVPGAGMSLYTVSRLHRVPIQLRFCGF